MDEIKLAKYCLLKPGDVCLSFHDKKFKNYPFGYFLYKPNNLENSQGKNTTGKIRILLEFHQW